MQTIPRGIVAGLVATVVLSLIMILKAAVGLLPQVNIVALLATLLGAPMLIGWLAHFVIGALLWGIIFALIYPQLPGRGTGAKALVFSVAAWLAMMIVFMPATGAGFFGWAIGPPAAVATLVLHLIWGAILGATFARL